MRGPQSFMMELYIETLTGTAFELRVSPFETIQSVKMKIQRLEGIPISQQHLIWNAMELDDDLCLHDYNIYDGATLKLVLAMRGGPINTRRIPMEDPTLREMAELMEASRDEIEKLPGKQVTLLVFRDGDHFNLFRVVDRGDGTLTPLSESFSPAGSVYDLHDEAEHEVESPAATPPKDKIEENEQMKEKVKLLRDKMETMSIERKIPKKKVHVPRPPSSGRPGSRTRYKRLASAGKRTTQNSLNSSLNKNIALPPVGQSVSLPGGKVLSQEVLQMIAQGGVGAPQGAVNSQYSLRSSSSSTDSNSAGSVKRRVESSAKLRRSLNLASLAEDADVIPTTSRPLTSSKDRHTSTSSLESAGGQGGITETLTQLPGTPRKEILYEHNTQRPITSSRKKELTLSSIKESLRPSGATSKTKDTVGKTREIPDIIDGYGRPVTSSRRDTITVDSTWRPSTTSRHSERKKEYTIESLGTSESRAMSGLLRQASIEHIGASRIGGFIPSPTKSRISYIQEEAGRVRTPEGRLVSARLQKMSTSIEGRLLSPTTRLPPVKVKKKSKRCFVCSKKTGLASSYSCRCGNNFCATHRYAESHDCTFDYKTEGRKLLEQSNPVVSAPKLPKI